VATISPPLSGGGYQLFVGTAAGELWALDPAKLTWEPVQVAEQWPTVLEGEWVGAIETHPDGDVWLGTWGGGLAHYADGAIQARYTITDGLPTQYIGDIALAPDAVLWAGGDLPPNIASFDGTTWTPRPFAEEDNVGSVLDVTVGPDGTVWVGAQASGLLRWTGQDWELITDPEGLTGWRIYDIEIDSHGTLWCATARGLVFYSDGTWSGQGGRETRAVEFGPGNAAYLLASDGIVWRYAGGQWVELPPPKEGHFLSAGALHVADDGAVWIGTQNGAFRYDGQAWAQFTAQDGLPANDVAAINQDADGWLWFGTENGAGRVDPSALDLSPVIWPVLPTPTTQASPTAIPQIAPTPTPCALSPAIPLAAYDDGRTADRLGCPTTDATATRGAVQPFEQGLMFWRANEGTIYVLSADGVWVRYNDTWNESQPAHDPSLTPPAGLQQPVRGFGKVWQEQLGGPQADIGWALASEQAYDILVQPFTAGQVFIGAGGKVYVLYADGTWESYETP
jgi:ligand-binding sensor domain-containing protein